MARPSNTEERRAEIVEAMLRVMAQNGYAKTTVAAIAREAGLAPGLVHYHFGSKQEVLLALVDRIAAGLRDRFVRMDPAGAAPRERLFAFLDAHLLRGPDADPDAVACWVALGTEALASPEVRAAYRRVVEEDLATLESLVREVLRDEGLDPSRAPRIAAGLFAAIEGAFRLAALAPRVIPEGSAAGTVRQMAEGLLR